MNKTKITLVIIIAFIVTFVYYIYQCNRHVVVFCDVGQGAATLFQMGDIQVLVDTGPDKSVLSCLGKYMPIFDKTIEVIILSHDQKDHDGALSFILSKYKVQNVLGPVLTKNINKKTNYTIVNDRHDFSISPFLFSIKKASQNSIDKNESANVVSVSTPSNVYFISSDISALELYRLMPPETSILEVPHHGSKYGLSLLSLSLAHPTLAVISVGKHNVYHHPAPETLAVLKAKKIPFLRTDEQGDIVLPLK